MLNKPALQKLVQYTLPALGLSIISSSAVAAGGAIEGEVERQAVNPTAIALFLVFVCITLGISYWASKRTTNSSDFYTAGGGITGLQNGAAIAGDFMSAASFLGITALIYATGVDGFTLALAAFAGWPMMLFLLSERVRNLGKVTFTDVVALRLEQTRTRIIAVLGSVSVVIMYLIAQMVGAGKLIELLFGLPYEVAVIIVALLVMAYVTFGGMLATTWVQITKAVLLLIGITIMGFLVLKNVGFDFNQLLVQATEIHPKGEAILRNGGWASDPIQIVTLLVSMMFGTLGLPHILMRLFTVPDMEQSRKSAFYASVFIGYFFILLVVGGFGTIAYVMGNPDYTDSAGKLIGGGNMAAIHLAHALGGDWLMGFMSAVAFATILAVVAGLTVAGSAAISHDLYAEVLCKGKPDPEKEMRLSRIVTVVLSLLAVGLGIIFQDQNVAVIATLPMVVAASVNLPILLLSLYWSKLTTKGAVAGAITGFVSAIGLIIIGPKVWVDIIGFGEALFPYDYPALFTMPLAFAAIWLFSILDNSERGEQDRAAFDSLMIQSETGQVS